MKQNQPGFPNNLVTIVIVAILVLIGLYLLKNKTASTLPTANNQIETNLPTSSPTNQAIQTDNDLTAISNELDNSDLKNMDSDLSQNDSDASSF